MIYPVTVHGLDIDKARIKHIFTYMDQRETLPPRASFYELVLSLYQQKQKAALLYEDNGVTRASGLITSVFTKEGRHYLQLDNELEIPIDQIQAINGLFSSDYSEC
jgi:hypothetical protein